MGCYVFSSQCDDSDLFVCRTVVVDRPIVAKGNIVASLSHTGRDAFDSLFGGRQPKIEQRHEVTFCLRPFYELYIRTRGQCRFNSKIGPFGQEVVHSLTHQSSCFDRHAFRVERRQAFRYFIRIDELLAAEHFGQYGIGCSRLSRTVAARYDI